MEEIRTPISLLLILLTLLNCCDSNELPVEPIHGSPKGKPGQETVKRTGNRLGKALIGDDGRIYACSQESFFSFESNGSMAWAVPLIYNCHPDMAPVLDDSGKIYFVAEDRILQVKPSSIGNHHPSVEIFFGPETAKGETGQIIGLAMSLVSSLVFITIRSRGLFAYTLQGRLLWSAGPVIDRFGYRQGCKGNVTGCSFTSAVAVDHCEGSLYISSSEGQLYSLATRSPHFNWIRDFSAFDKLFKITPGNNGLIYLVFPRRSLLMAVDVFTGDVRWRQNVGPLSIEECTPAVDTNGYLSYIGTSLKILLFEVEIGWASIGSLDGFLYSFSPTGYLKKYLRATELGLVQVSPLLDCSGSALYVSRTKMESKTIHTIGENLYVSATKPAEAIITLLSPATGAVYWIGKYPGQLSSLLFESDLRHFMLDEGTLLAFAASTRRGMRCPTTRQKLARSCSQTERPHLNLYMGNERTILLFLLFQFAILVLLAGLVRSCQIFWGKKKLQDQDLAKFLEKRRSLHKKKKEFIKTISEMEQKAKQEAPTDNEVLLKLEDMVKERERIERKLSTTYSLGRDRPGSFDGSGSHSLLPECNRKTTSHSFCDSSKGNTSIFHTPSGSSSEDTSSIYSRSSCDSSSGRRENHVSSEVDPSVEVKAPLDVGSMSSVGIGEFDRLQSPTLARQPWVGKLSHDNSKQKQKQAEDAREVELMEVGTNTSKTLSKRRTMSFT